VALPFENLIITGGGIWKGANETNAFGNEAPLSMAGDRNNPSAPSSLKHANARAARAQCAQV
jgi:hypothetical protein